VHAQDEELWDPLTVDITRGLAKTLFESNAVPYVQPMVVSINATSNARFYDQAYVPTKVDKPYFRVSMNGMVGFITDEMRTFAPTLNLGEPSSNPVADLGQFGTFGFQNGQVTYTIGPRYEDTLGLAQFVLRELFIDANAKGYIGIPASAATLFGSQPDTRLILPTSAQLQEVLKEQPGYAILPASTQQLLDSLIGSIQLPPYLTFPPGVDMSTLIAAVPQLEIGSFYGTELLLRYIPPVQFDANVGKFSFWGVGLKHSISQYFPERWFDCAVQGVYQGTSLTNTVGLTQSELDAEATIWSANIHASKQFGDVFNVFTGFSYESIGLTSTYEYVLPQEVQLALGLLPPPPAPGMPSVPTEEQPGDQEPQTSVVRADDTNIKWTIGAAAQFGIVRVFADYSVSGFNIFTGGVSVQF
jgi:hypothetical protein